jgi:hypothetical protein
LNIRKPRGQLTPHACQSLEHAWIVACRHGRPLNRLVSIKPGGDLSPLCHVELVDRTWNKLGGWSRYHSGGEFFCVLVREKEPANREHFHVLIHVPKGKLDLFEETIPRWFGPSGADIDIRPANQALRRTPGGKIRSMLGYLTKQRSPQAAWRSGYSRQRGAPVLGKRYRITRNLLPNKVAAATPANGNVRVQRAA